MIRAAGLTKEHQRGRVPVTALDGVDLSVDDGEFVAVMGPSGCGKSSLLQLLGELDVPTAGSVALDGSELAGLDEEARAALRRTSIGFVFQQFHLIPSLDVTENVALTAIVSGERRQAWLPRVAPLLDTLGLTLLADRTPSTLSGGEQQRVAIARSLFHQPKVLLADEPTGSLDSVNGASVLALVDRARARRRLRTVVMATHDPVTASRADRVVFMRDGRMTDEMDLRDTEGVDRVERLRLRLASARP